MVEEGGFYIRFSLQPCYDRIEPLHTITIQIFPVLPPLYSLLQLRFISAHVDWSRMIAPLSRQQIAKAACRGHSILLDTKRSFSHSLRKAACCVAYIPIFRHCQHTLARHAA